MELKSNPEPKTFYAFILKSRASPEKEKEKRIPNVSWKVWNLATLGLLWQVISK